MGYRILCIRSAQSYLGRYGSFSVVRKGDNTGILERGWGMFCASRKELSDNQPVPDNIFAKHRGKKRISGYMAENIYTESRYTRVLRMHRTHKCHKPAHQGGNHHTLAKSREGDRNKMYYLPILFVMGMGMVTRAAKKKLGGQGWTQGFNKHQSEALWTILQ